eukprot:Lithocolla_globosa_v1_NODE_3117_length_1762_cov_33.436438.p1 type:complete len:536 gc:universal NODE_3117_length_1762_cov_33.436438:1707-100(-)
MEESENGDKKREPTSESDSASQASFSSLMVEPSLSELSVETSSTLSSASVSTDPLSDRPSSSLSERISTSSAPPAKEREKAPSVSRSSSAPPGTNGQPAGTESMFRMSQLTELFSVMKGMIGSKDIDSLKVGIPLWMLEPESLLSGSCFMHYPETFLSIPQQQTPLARMVALVSFQVGTMKNFLNTKKKPINPLIGEHYALNIPIPVNSDPTEQNNGESGSASESTQTSTNIQYITEQTSHHPPVNTWYYGHEPSGMSFAGNTLVIVSFDGTSVKIVASGRQIMTLTQWPGSKEGDKETYHVIMDDSSLHFRGFLTGKPFVDLNGITHIVCPQTKYVTKIRFCEKPWFSGEYGLVEGSIHDNTNRQVARIKGKWSEQLLIDYLDLKTNQWKDKWEVMSDQAIPSYDFTSISKLSAENNDHHMDPLASATVWGEVCDAMRNDDYDYARNEKSRLETRQRVYHKEMASSEDGHTPYFFEEISEVGLGPDETKFVLQYYPKNRRPHEQVQRIFKLLPEEKRRENIQKAWLKPDETQSQ